MLVSRGPQVPNFGMKIASARLERHELVRDSTALATSLGPSAIESVILALFCISAAIQWNDGALARAALAYVTVGMLACIWGLQSKALRLRWIVPWAVLLYEIQALLNSLPTVDRADWTAFHLAIWTAAALGIAACGSRNLRARRVAMIAAVAGVFICGVLLLRSGHRPSVDVWDLHQQASKALWSGSNPYKIRTRDIYAPEYSRKFYGPGMSLGGYLTVGFPYPPISLFLSSLGYLAAGDYRYAHLVLICLSALMLGYSGAGAISSMGAMLFLFCPRVFLVLENGWSEPTIVFLFALVVFCRQRFPRLAPWMTGLLLTGKQYMIFTAPAVLRRWRDVPKAVLAGLLITAPLLLWDVREFLNSAVFFHFAQPTRPDALSYMAALMRYNIHLPGWVPFALTLAAWLYVLRRSPRTTSEICIATSLLLLVFFMFNKSAFCNYYYLVLCTLGGAIATLEPASVGDHTS